MGEEKKPTKLDLLLTLCSFFSAFQRGTNGSHVDISLRAFLLPLTTRSGVLAGRSVADGHLPFPALKPADVSDIPAQVERVQELEAVGTFRRV